MTLQLPKGTRDLSQGEAITRNKIIGELKNVFELYGFLPLETPVFEKYDVLASKYAGGTEILKETFKLKDQGKRELGLRYDLTVPMCRFVGMNPNLKMPFKRYAIGEVFRDGPVENARYRQFTQCDVDIVGVKGMEADAEVITLANRAFNKLGLDFTIKINNRKLLNDILSYCGVNKDNVDGVILSLDKLEKFGIDIVKKELSAKKIGKKPLDKILKIISIKGSNSRKIVALKKIIKNSGGITEVENLLKILKISKVGVVLDISLARGLSYYTGTVLEVVLKNSKVKSSVCGGGRYDNMIGSFLGKGEYPAMGLSFGLDRIIDAFTEKKDEGKKTTSQVFIIPIGTFKDSLLIAEELRNENIKVSMDLMGKGPSKNLKYANSMGVPYALIVGKKELNQGKVKLKDMKSGKESMMDAKELVFFLHENLD
jgi:histidyl-tRNA synthetase